MPAFIISLVASLSCPETIFNLKGSCVNESKANTLIFHISKRFHSKVSVENAER